MLSELVTCNCVGNLGGHAESNPRPSVEGVSLDLVLRPLDQLYVSELAIAGQLHGRIVSACSSVCLSCGRARLLFKLLRKNKLDQQEEMACMFLRKP